MKDSKIKSISHWEIISNNFEGKYANVLSPRVINELWSMGTHTHNWNTHSHTQTGEEKHVLIWKSFLLSSINCVGSFKQHFRNVCFVVAPITHSCSREGRLMDHYNYYYPVPSGEIGMCRRDGSIRLSSFQLGRSFSYRIAIIITTTINLLCRYVVCIVHTRPILSKTPFGVEQKIKRNKNRALVKIHYTLLISFNFFAKPSRSA